MGTLIEQNVSAAAIESPATRTKGTATRSRTSSRKKPLGGVFAALLVFMVIYLRARRTGSRAFLPSPWRRLPESWCCSR